MSKIISKTIFYLAVINYCCYYTIALHNNHDNTNRNSSTIHKGFMNNDNSTADDGDEIIATDYHDDWEQFVSDDNEKTSVDDSNEMVMKTGRGLRRLRARLRFIRQRGNRQNDETQLRKSIKFIYYKNNDKTHEGVDEGAEKGEEIGDCKINDRFAFILHGWRQSCDIEWMPKLIERLSEHRGGCIVCIDYSSFAKESYMWLYRNFKLISQLITLRIFKLIDQGFDPSKGYMFGFSFGGQLAITVGQAVAINYKHLKSIDTCDMAGPGFDIGTSLADHRSAAENVQCLHSSRDKGTRIYACHQNIRLGNCGINQPAATSQAIYSSHGLCVQIYLNAFDYPFYALANKPQWCISYNPAENVPPSFTIGYKENHNSNITGEIFVPTGLYFPYNLEPEPPRRSSQLTVKLLRKCRKNVP